MRKHQDRRRGRHPVYPDAQLVPLGVTLHPEQAKRLRAFAVARGTNVSAVVRQALDAFERDGGLSGAG